MAYCGLSISVAAGPVVAAGPAPNNAPTQSAAAAAIVHFEFTPGSV